MPPRHMPPLNMLRVFEAAARHLSFAKAADELAVTPAAVSHQIKALEDFLQRQLFRRYNRRLELTAEGRDYLPPLGRAFDDIARATRQVSGSPRSSTFRVRTLQSLAAKWLIPRLPELEVAHPGIDPAISTSARRSILTDDEFDAAIWLGEGQLPGLVAEQLFVDDAFPVCSPRLLDSASLDSAADLERHVLLHDTSIGPADSTPTWPTWLARVGLAPVTGARSVAFGDSALMIQAAIAGQGVAIGKWALVMDDLRAGYLIRPFGPAVRMHFAWWLVQRPENVESAVNRTFRDWLQKEFGILRAQIESYPVKDHR